MIALFIPLLITLVDLLRSRASFQLEMLALRQQLAMVTSRDGKRLRSGSWFAVGLAGGVRHELLSNRRPSWAGIAKAGRPIGGGVHDEVDGEGAAISILNYRH